MIGLTAKKFVRKYLPMRLKDKLLRMSLYGRYLKAIAMCDLPPPNVVAVEVTNHCNLKCVMCPNPQMKRKRGYMKFDLFQQIVDEIKSFSPVVKLYTTGESLLHPRIFDMIQYLKETTDCSVVLSTNVTLFKDKVIEALLDPATSPHTLQLSIEGCTPQEYEYFRKGAKFEDVYKKLEAFSELKRNAHNCYPITQIHFLLTKKSDPVKFVRLWGRFCDYISVSIMQPPQFKKIPNEIKDILYYPDPTRKKICPQPFNTVTISYDGRISACCGDFELILEMGNLEENRILEIWNNKKYKELRKRLVKKEGEKTKCRGCVNLYDYDPSIKLKLKKTIKIINSELKLIKYMYGGRNV